MLLQTLGAVIMQRYCCTDNKGVKGCDWLREVGGYQLIGGVRA